MTIIPTTKPSRGVFPSSWGSAVAKRHRHQFPHMATHLHVHPSFFLEGNHVRPLPPKRSPSACDYWEDPVPQTPTEFCSPPVLRGAVLRRERVLGDTGTGYCKHAVHAVHAQLLGTSFNDYIPAWQGEQPASPKSLKPLPPFAESFSP